MRLCCDIVTMEKRIELEKRGRSPSEIEDLNLDNCKSVSMYGLNEEWTSLKNLSLINVGLTSLKSFPCLPALQKLELSDNCISGGLEALSGLPKLINLNLSGNKITIISTLEPLKSLKTLIILDLFNCDVSNLEGYRQKMFEMIPSLVYLDGFDKDGNEFDEDEDGEEDIKRGNKKEGAGEKDDDDDVLDDEEDFDDENDFDDDDDEDDDEEDDEEHVPLDAIYNHYDPEGDTDYEAAEEGEEDEEIEEEEEEEDADGSVTNTTVNNEGGGRGKKRKHEGEEQ